MKKLGFKPRQSSCYLYISGICFQLYHLSITVMKNSLFKVVSDCGWPSKEAQMCSALKEEGKCFSYGVLFWRSQSRYGLFSGSSQMDNLSLPWRTQAPNRRLKKENVESCHQARLGWFHLRKYALGLHCEGRGGGYLPWVFRISWKTSLNTPKHCLTSTSNILSLPKTATASVWL